jgi:hypothetical protein
MLCAFQGTLIVLLQRIIKQEDGVYLLLKDPNLERLYLYLVKNHACIVVLFANINNGFWF